MGFALGDIARTPEDFTQVRELIGRLSPSSIVPPIGEPNNVTYVIRDEEARQRIVGLIHVEHAVEVRNMIVMPEYEYQDVSFTLLHRCMEMNLRTANIGRYYFTVPKDHARALKMFRRDGADMIDGDMIRFRKEL